MDETLLQVCTNAMKLSQAARQFNMPHKTLMNRLQIRSLIIAKPGEVALS